MWTQISSRKEGRELLERSRLEFSDKISGNNSALSLAENYTLEGLRREGITSLHAFFISNTSISNARLKLAKN